MHFADLGPDTREMNDTSICPFLPEVKNPTKALKPFLESILKCQYLMSNHVSPELLTGFSSNADLKKKKFKFIITNYKLYLYDAEFW